MIVYRVRHFTSTVHEDAALYKAIDFMNEQNILPSRLIRIDFQSWVVSTGELNYAARIIYWEEEND